MMSKVAGSLVANGHGAADGTKGKAGNAPSEPARTTTGFNVVNERLVFFSQVLIGYKVEVQVGKLA